MLKTTAGNLLQKNSLSQFDARGLGNLGNLSNQHTLQVYLNCRQLRRIEVLSIQKVYEHFTLQAFTIDDIAVALCHCETSGVLNGEKGVTVF